MVQMGSVSLRCANGHPMASGQNFCPLCGAVVQKTVPPPVPSLAQSSSPDNFYQGLVIVGVILLIIAAVLLFSTPHASYNEYVPSSSGGFTQQTANVGCITAWNNLVGNHPVFPTPNYPYQQDNTASANTACAAVIAGRQRIAIPLALIAVGMLIAAGVRRSRRLQQA